MNGAKTALLLGFFSSILIFGGQAVAGEPRHDIRRAVGNRYELLQLLFFGEDSLDVCSQIVSETQYPEINARLKPIVEDLSRRAGIPLPKLLVQPGALPNAFATGRNPKYTSVAVTLAFCN